MTLADVEESSATQHTEGEDAILSIDELQNYGVNASDIQKLKSSGICSIPVSVKTTFLLTSQIYFTKKISLSLKITYDDQLFSRYSLIKPNASTIFWLTIPRIFRRSKIYTNLGSFCLF